MRRFSILLGLVLTLAVAAPAAARVDAVYTADLQALNDSGAKGHAVLQLRGDQLTVRVTVSGVEPSVPHLQHIHGFADRTESQCPPPAADTDMDGLIGVFEGAAFYGPEFVKTLSTDGQQDPLNTAIAPVANRGGSYTYTYTFTVDGDAADVADESIVVHGLDIDGDGMVGPEFMEVSLPVLCGEITRRS